jgi:glycosyltransferase involved in cell wall biosynthesis
MNPDISIITINYNSDSGLEKTVDSVSPFLNLLNAEYILIDGLSTDDSFSRLGNKLKFFDKICSEKDFGIYDAMNKGLKQSKGGWIWFLNSGDIALDSIVLIKPILLNSNNKTNFIYGNFALSGSGIVSQHLSHSLLFTGMLNHQSVIYKKDILDAFDLSYGLVADFAHLLKNYNQIKPYKIEFPIVEYDLFGQSASFTRRTRVKIWYQRFRAFRNSSLPAKQKCCGMIASLLGCLIKGFFPRLGSKTLKLRLNIKK